MQIIFFKSILIFLLISAYTFLIVDFKKFSNSLKKYLFASKELLFLIKNSKKIEISLLKNKLDGVTKSGLDLIINIILISIPFIFSLILYKFIGLDFSMPVLILCSSLPYSVFLLK